MLTRIDHIEIVVKNVEEFVGFYKKLGFREVQRTTNHRVSVEMQLPGPNQPIFEIHELVEGKEKLGIDHIAFAVDDIQKAYDELQADGMKFFRELHLEESSGRYLANTRDSEGFKLQLVSAKREKPKVGGKGSDPFGKG
jgi:catechol 2,3-dioxygenase-like lactoylglutathione lyase family enzyme